MRMVLNFRGIFIRNKKMGSNFKDIEMEPSWNSANRSRSGRKRSASNSSIVSKISQDGFGKHETTPYMYAFQQKKQCKEEVECIDVFCLRILSLLICRGSNMEKAEYLASIINKNYI